MLSPTAAALIVRVKDLRARRGLSQRELAARVGVTRQAISAIEARTYVPNTGVAVRLAQVLECRVEDLFRSTVAAEPTFVELAKPLPAGVLRVALGHVRGRWIAHSIDGWSIGEGGLTAADGLVASGRATRQVRLLTDVDEIESSALLLGCDPALGILAALVPRRNREARLSWVPAVSRTALDAVRRGGAHAGGSHGRSAAKRPNHLVRARQALAPTGGIVVSFARWEEGLVVSRAARDRVRGVADLAQRDLQIVNREIGAGARTLLDEELDACGVAASRVRGYDRIVPGHVSAAAAVAAGAADAAVSLRALAEAFELTFVPLAEERFDIAIPADHLEHPAIATMLDVLQERRLRADLGSLPGYDASHVGEVVEEIAVDT